VKDKVVNIEFNALGANRIFSHISVKKYHHRTVFPEEGSNWQDDEFIGLDDCWINSCNWNSVQATKPQIAQVFERPGLTLDDTKLAQIVFNRPFYIDEIEVIDAPNGNAFTGAEISRRYLLADAAPGTWVLDVSADRKTLAKTKISAVQFQNNTGADKVITISLKKYHHRQVFPEEGAIFDTQPQEPAYIRGRDYTYEDDDFEAGDSPAVHDVNTDLGRNAHAGYIICDGAGDITVEISNDGATYGGVHTMKEGEKFNLDKYDVDTIRITYVTADSAYRIGVL
jgi:hypothetical protein